MTNTIQQFGLTEKEVIRKNNEFYLPLSKLTQILGTTKNNLQKNIQMNRDEFGSLLMESNSTNSVGRPAMILNEEQIYTLCMISRSPKAKEFRRVFAKMIKAIRQKEFVHISEVEKLKEELAMQHEYAAVLAKIPGRKLSRYKKFRALGMSRKELCKALELSYRKMKKADVILGFYKPNPGAAKYLEPYHVMPGGKRRYQLEGLRQGFDGDFDGAQSDSSRHEKAAEA